MDHKFAIDLEINGMHLHQLEGFAVIERCQVEPDNWTLGDVYIHNSALRSSPLYEERKLTCGHHLHLPVSMFLLNQLRQEIDEAWNQHLSDCIANLEAA